VLRPEASLPYPTWRFHFLQEPAQSPEQRRVYSSALHAENHATFSGTDKLILTRPAQREGGCQSWPTASWIDQRDACAPRRREELRGQLLRSSGTFPPFSANFCMTCLCSQMFIEAESFMSPE
jgi:hypothetical protein